MKRDASHTGGGNVVALRDYAPRHFLHPTSHAAKLEVAMRLLGDRYVFAKPIQRTEHTERTSILDRWRAERHSA